MEGVGAVLRAGTEADTAALREIWDICFPEDAVFNDFFFEKMYDPKKARLAVADGRAAAALYLFDYKIAAGGRELRAAYVYGVGTHPAWRGHGLAGRLIENALEELTSRGADICMLVPQSRSLFAFYERFGFSPAFALQREEWTLKEAGALRPADESDTALLDRIYETSLGAIPHVRRGEEEWRLLIEEFRLSGGGIYLMEDSAYVALGDKCAYEAMGTSPDARKLALCRAANMCGGAISAVCAGGDAPYGSACPTSDEGRALMHDGMGVYMNLMHS